MNKYGVIIVLIFLLTIAYAVAVGLKYSHATILFGTVAVFLAPIAIHKVTSVGSATGFLTALALFASFPFNKLFQLDGTLWGLLVTFLYAGFLWTTGAGWRRSWKQEN